MNYIFILAFMSFFLVACQPSEPSDYPFLDSIKASDPSTQVSSTVIPSDPAPVDSNPSSSRVPSTQTPSEYDCKGKKLGSIENILTKLRRKIEDTKQGDRSDLREYETACENFKSDLVEGELSRSNDRNEYGNLSSQCQRLLDKMEKAESDFEKAKNKVEKAEEEIEEAEDDYDDAKDEYRRERSEETKEDKEDKKEELDDAEDDLRSAKRYEDSAKKDYDRAKRAFDNQC